MAGEVMTMTASVAFPSATSSALVAKAEAMVVVVPGLAYSSLSTTTHHLFCK